MCLPGLLKESSVSEPVGMGVSGDMVKCGGLERLQRIKAHLWSAPMITERASKRTNESSPSNKCLQSWAFVSQTLGKSRNRMKNKQKQHRRDQSYAALINRLLGSLFSPYLPTPTRPVGAQTKRNAPTQRCSRKSHRWHR